MHKTYNELKLILERSEFQKHLDYFNKKYKDKRIVLFGAGLLLDVIFDNFDLSKLNIVRIADSKYLLIKEKYREYETISPDEIAEINPDIILLSVYEHYKLRKFLKSNYRELSKIPMIHIIKKSFLNRIKVFLFGY